VPHRLSWYSVREALCLELENVLSIDEMEVMSRQINDLLNKSDQKLMLMIDVSKLTVGYHTVNHLRQTQRYMDHPNLQTLVLMADNKLNRLTGLLVFNLARARLVQFDSREKSRDFMTTNGVMEANAAIS
jgi:hypothetical protein